MASRSLHFLHENEDFFVTPPSQVSGGRRTPLFSMRSRIKVVTGPADDGLGCARGALIGLAIEIAAGACIYGIWLLFHAAH
jgi:hypothetical protein